MQRNIAKCLPPWERRQDVYSQLTQQRNLAATAVDSGATKTYRVLNATNQEVTIWCVGQVKVGIGITGVTGAPTLSFLGSTDGVQFNPITVAPYPSAMSSAQGNLPAAGVTSASAAGNFEVNVGNLQFIRVQMTNGNGPATVVLTASVDGSYQEAFFTQAALYPSSSSAAGINTVNIPAQANRAIALSYVSVSVSGGGVNAGSGTVRSVLATCYTLKRSSLLPGRCPLCSS